MRLRAISITIAVCAAGAALIVPATSSGAAPTRASKARPVHYLAEAYAFTPGGKGQFTQNAGLLKETILTLPAAYKEAGIRPAWKPRVILTGAAIQHDLAIIVTPYYGTIGKHVNVERIFSRNTPSGVTFMGPAYLGNTDNPLPSRPDAGIWP
jgi:hypothetical protein